MIIDLFHNKIVKDTATEGFVESFNSTLVPMLEDKYGDALEAVTMYEDYLADNLLFEGEWYYPLSVKLYGEDAIICWIKWPVSKKTFRNNIPYAYTGSDGVDFAFAGFVPTGFADKLQGRAIDYDRKALKLTVEAVTDDPTLLVGKYSQTFVDELASQITGALCENLGVTGFENSTMELQLVFAPGTYLEHTSENVTYRRLLLVDKGCQARDFWVKWTRLTGNGGYKVSDNVNSDNVIFQLGEDVAQKIREKEYRFLAGANPSKYQAAMGKKTVTEWRDITKRAIKRGDLEKIADEPVIAPISETPAYTAPVVDTPAVDDVNDQLRALLGSFGVATSAPEEPVAEPTDSYDVVAELAKSVLETEAEDEFEVEVEEIEQTADEPVAVEETVDEPVIDEVVAEPAIAVDTTEEVEEFIPEMKSVFDFDFGISDEPAEEIFSMGEVTLEEYETVTANVTPEETKTVDADAIRREIEAKLRLEYETEARLRAEREAEQLRLEHERLREENERLAKIAKEAEAKRIAEEEARRQEEEARRLAEEERQRELEAKRAEEERLRAELEAKMRLEAEERARIAEAARMAVEEQKRLEAERAAKEERERREVLEREAERLRKEEEARRLEEQRRREEQQRREEEERRRREEEEAKARVAIVTKQAKLMFRYAVDLNVVKRIKEVVETTLLENNKEKLNIHIKAYPQDSNSIGLEIKLPQNEMDLLVSMMKALGGASIGITKITLE